MPTRRAVVLGFFLAAIYGPDAFASTASWKPITGATGQKYTPRLGDKGHRLRCKVTAHNSAGSATAHTPPTNVVKGT